MALTCATHLVLLHQVLFGLSRWAKPSAEPPTATTPTPILHFWGRSQNTGGLCYVRIPKESGRDRERKIKGRKRIRLIAIDYRSATGTARTGCRRSKSASWPESGMDSGGPSRDTGTEVLDQAERTERSNVDSGELRIQSTRLKYKEGGTGKITHETRIRRKSG